MTLADELRWYTECNSEFTACPVAADRLDALEADNADLAAKLARFDTDRQIALQKRIALDAEVDQLRAERDALVEKNNEWEESFDLYDAACRRGLELWRAERPDERGVSQPGTTRLVAWLLEEITRANGRRGQAEADWEEAKAERDALKAKASAYDAAADKFIAKVEDGRAISRETYADLKAARALGVGREP